MESETMPSPGLFRVKKNVLNHGDQLFYPEAIGRGEFIRGYIGTGENEKGPYVFSKDDLIRVRQNA